MCSALAVAGVGKNWRRGGAFCVAGRGWSGHGTDGWFGLAWSPLASGFLADNFDLAALTAGDLRRRLRWADPAVVDLAGLRRDLSVIASGAGLSMSALAAGWVLAQGAQPVIGARTPAEAGQIAAFRPIPPDLAAAAQTAVDAAFTTTR